MEAKRVSETVQTLHSAAAAAAAAATAVFLHPASASSPSTN